MNRMKLATLLIAATLAMISPLMVGGTAHAFTTTPPSVSSSLTLWDWRGYIYCANMTDYYTTGSCGSGALTTPNDKLQYVVYQQPSDAANHQIEIAVNHSQCIDLAFYNVSGDNKLGGIVLDTFGSHPAHYCASSWGSPGTKVAVATYTFKDGNAYVNTAVGGASTNYINVSAITVANIDGVQSAYNVAYDSSYTGGHFSGFEVPYTRQGSATGCTTFDVSCKISQAFESVTDGIKDLGHGMVDVIAKIFMPDGDQVKADFDSFNTFMSAKLGFLLFPFTFLVNLFNAFGGTGSWCTSSSCVKDFGNLWGHDFSLNLLQLQVTMPTIWTWFLTLIRGLTILEIVVVLRRKYLSVVQR